MDTPPPCAPPGDWHTPLVDAIIDGDWSAFSTAVAGADYDSLTVAIRCCRVQMAQQIIDVLQARRPGGLDLGEELSAAVDQWCRFDQSDVLELVRLLLHCSRPLDALPALRRAGGDMDAPRLFELLYDYFLAHAEPAAIASTVLRLGARCARLERRLVACGPFFVSDHFFDDDSSDIVRV